jgi:hypothetical protein
MIATAVAMVRNVAARAAVVDTRARGLESMDDMAYQTHPSRRASQPYLAGPHVRSFIPAGELFSLANPGSEPFLAVALVPVGGQATLPGGEPFSPPWTQ